MIDRLPSLHPYWTVFLAQALQNSKWGAIDSQVLRVILHLFVSVSILAFPPYSLVSAFWRVAFLTLRQVPLIITRGRIGDSAGPLGKGYAKVSSIGAAYILWIAARRCNLVSASQNPLQLGAWPPDKNLLFIVLVISTQVNYVLSLWSRLSQSRGNHQGVQQMVDKLPVRLGWKHHLRLAFLAVVNAICEEGESRGFWRSEYELAGLGRRDSNLAQALFFGIWHYNGIPSGVSGVCLTFVYGLLMGYLQDATQGLLLPILAHAVADYYIFAHVSRRALQQGTSQLKRRQTLPAHG